MMKLSKKDNNSVTRNTVNEKEISSIEDMVIVKENDSRIEHLVEERNILKEKPTIRVNNDINTNRVLKQIDYGYSEELFKDEDDTPYSAFKRGDIKETFDNDDSTKDEEYLTSDGGVIQEYVEQLVNYFTMTNPQTLNLYERNVISKEDFIKKVIEQIKDYNLNEDLSVSVLNEFKKYMWSYGILDELIDDPDISDIKVLAYNCIRVKRKGIRETSNIRFKDKKAFVRFVDRVAIKNKVSISDLNAVTNFTDTESNNRFIMRWNISTPFVNSGVTPYIHIRKIDKIKVDIPELMNRGMMDANIARYLRRQVSHSEGILFTGKGASGKTTCMNALIDLIPLSKSGLVIQENEELFSRIHPDMMFQHTVLNKGEGKIEYTLQDLGRNGLLLDLDFFIIGEIKGSEALYMLNASYTGHVCWASVHGASSTEGINKLVDYIKYASDYSREDALHMLIHMGTVVFMKEYKVWEISEIVGWDEKKKDLIYKPIVRDGKLVVRIGKHGEVLD